MEKDDLGIEIDDEVSKVLADPKAALLKKTFDYWEKRREKEREIEAMKEANKKKSEGIFGGLFS